MKSIKNNRIPRSDQDLIGALSDNLSLLKDAIERAKVGDFKYIKTIKAILRVLVHSAGSNKALLVELAKKYSLTPIIKTNGPRGDSVRSLNEYLEEVAFVSVTENIMLRNKDLIAKGSQQEGGAHEDWDIDKDYLFAKGDGILIGGMPPLVRKFIGMANCIYTSGVDVLNSIASSKKNQNKPV